MREPSIILIVSRACKNCRYGVHTDCYAHQCVTADGVERGFAAINRQFPGPAIEVCRNDLLIVDVHNAISASATTIHWHGQLQHGTQYMVNADRRQQKDE